MVLKYLEDLWNISGQKVKTLKSRIFSQYSARDMKAVVVRLLIFQLPMIYGNIWLCSFLRMVEKIKIKNKNCRRRCLKSSPLGKLNFFPWQQNYFG